MIEGKGLYYFITDIFLDIDNEETTVHITAHKRMDRKDNGRMAEFQLPDLDFSRDMDDYYEELVNHMEQVSAKPN